MDYVSKNKVGQTNFDQMWYFEDGGSSRSLIGDIV